MRRPFPVIDADGHVLERDRELREFLPPEYRPIKGKREYPLFAWDGWARGALSPGAACVRWTPYGERAG